MTAPTKNRPDVDVVDSRDQATKQVSGAQAHDHAERRTQLLNEIFARGVLPAL